MCMNRIQDTNDGFLNIKPRVERHARFVFRSLSVADREDAVAEAVAAAFKSFISLLQRGKDPFQFPAMIATRAVQHVRNGRRIGGRSQNRDVFARARTSNPDCRIRTLPHEANADWPEALIDNHRTPIPEQVSFRCDFPRWLASLAPRDRAIANLLAMGHSTKSLADRFGLSAARISQLRAELHADWTSFHGLG